MVPECVRDRTSSEDSECWNGTNKVSLVVIQKYLNTDDLIGNIVTSAH